MENTINNKAKFFAQYFGQEVRVWNSIPNNKCNVGYAALTEESVPNSYLILKKPINFDLNLEDVNEGIEYFKKIKFDGNNPDEICTVDFMRSKGYALPYMGLDIEKLVEYGWIKLV